MGASALPHALGAPRIAVNGPGILAALPEEARSAGGSRMQRGEIAQLADGLLILAGVGQDSAAAAAQRLYDAGAPGLVSFGTAGGLDPALPTGSLVVPREIIDDEGRRYASDGRWRDALMHRLSARIPCHEGALFSARRPAVQVTDKQEAHARWGAVAVDMESAAVARVAEHHRIPFLAIRVVLDGAGHGLPRAALVAFDAQGRLRLGALVRALAARPQEVAGLHRLSRQFRVSLAVLARVRSLTAPGLAWMGSEVEA